MFHLSAHLWSLAIGNSFLAQPTPKTKGVRYLCGCGACDRFSDILAAHPLRIA